jgi:(1->4)-alpha-D-glucan 1-alpha-D-glucosylmutase
MEQPPRATYRLQLTPEFGFARARALVPYLRELGVSHLYLSPSLQARAGSQHGYDVIDPNKLSDQLGGRRQFESLAAAARRAGLGIVLDVVPNHMAADEHNRYWSDAALRARVFDIDPATGRHRRFFDINELAAVRQEDPEVFEATHALVLDLVREGYLDGLRIDHPDGLADPAGYLRRLRERGASSVWVEKILDPKERLRDWPVCGTVGYEFLNDACALFVDPAGEAPLSALWERIAGERRSFAEVAREAKLEQARGTFRPELERLARALLAEDLPPPAARERDAGAEPKPAASRWSDDAREARAESGRAASRWSDDGGNAEAERLAAIVPGGLDALAQALASLPVYRTYVDPIARTVADEDREAIARSGMAPELARRLLLERDAPTEFVTRFQQMTPAIMAKGVEDTAFYRHLRLLALNDVGGDPGRFGISPDDFHRRCAERLERFPANLLTTQTHDAKRSADVRARIAALASLPELWEQAVSEWFERSERYCRAGAPDDQERYLIFQTLAGAWPFPLERLQAYVRKALREAKRNTNWVDPNPDWERAASEFCRALYADGELIASLERFVARLRPVGQRAALGQLVLKLTAPGVPDIYQGDELELRALVDPDNRRPVDFGARERLLRELRAGARPATDTLKLHVTATLLALRARRSEVFARGSYEPLDAGAGGCAFVRGGQVLVAVSLPRAGADGAGALSGAPRGRWRELGTGAERSFGAREPLGDLAGELGFAVFERL